jgi:hypothetical protein
MKKRTYFEPTFLVAAVEEEIHRCSHQMMAMFPLFLVSFYKTVKLYYQKAYLTFRVYLVLLSLLSSVVELFYPRSFRTIFILVLPTFSVCCLFV